MIQLGEYKLTNAFVGDRSLKNGDPDEDEPDPEPIAFACGLKNGDPDEDEPDPESIAFACGLKNGDPDEDEPDPESIAFGLGGDSLGTDLEPWDPRLRDVLAIMCRSGEVDDHGDTVACATRSNLGHAVVGEIRNDWGDDLDFFTFRLNELRTVEIGTAGWTDTFGSLYDRSGHRLATDDDSGDGDNFRIATTLAPGWYFVRVEGQLRDEGAYSLSVNASSW
ncbi:MAG: hypothetical protein GY719_31335 [bacterium]|nr:hypothetical protein [bacterium]